MKDCVWIMFILIAVNIQGAADEMDEMKLTFMWNEMPLYGALQDYAKATGKSVERSHGVDVKITMASEEPITTSEYVELIERKLSELNIGLYSFADNRVIATWIEPPATHSLEPPPTPSYLDKMPQEIREEFLQFMREKRETGRTEMPSKESVSTDLSDKTLDPNPETESGTDQR